MAGWIKLHRKLMDHWIWDNPEKLKWWLEIILLANHTDKKILNNNQLEVMERGTFHTSELKLAKRWNVSRNTVRKFLSLLESDNMISIKKANNGTTIKVHNYGLYQENSEIKKQRIEHQNEQQCEHRTEQRNMPYLEKQAEENANSNQNNEQPFEQQNEQAERRRDKGLRESPSKSLNNGLNNGVNISVNNGLNTEQNNGVNTTKELKELKNVKNEKKKDTREGARVNAFDFYQQNGFGVINQYTSEDISYFLDKFEEDSDEIVIKALKIAIDRNKINWAYAKAILNSWLNSNLKSINEVRAYEKQKKVNYQNSQNKAHHGTEMEKTPKWLLDRKTSENGLSKDSSEDFEDKRKELEEQVKEWSEEFGRTT